MPESSSNSPQNRRVTLTSKNVGDDIGRKLIKVLLQVLEDGVISQDETVALKKWLTKASGVSDLPGIHFLREEVESVLSDGKVDEDEADRLVTAILRVLPSGIREQVKPTVTEIRQKRREKERQTQSKSLFGPTEKQLAFIKSLGGGLPQNATREDASDLIDRLLNSRPTARQCMVLRFWDRTDLMNEGVDGVSAWMDRFYLEDPDRLLAWMRWKVDSGDSGSGSRSYFDVDQVPIGIGQQYLARVKHKVPPSRPDPVPSSGINPIRWLLWTVAAILALVAGFVIFSRLRS